MDWFQQLTGFRELDYRDTRERLAVEGGQLVSLMNDRRFSVGSFELPSLAELRQRVADRRPERGRLRVRNVVGDVRELHGSDEFRKALFQVASQFNCLEMISPHYTPEDGVTRYQNDHTQGPACAIAAGAATIFRNYFLPVDGVPGQTRARQIDTLADAGDELARRIGCARADLWEMRNGYALCSIDGLGKIARLLGSSPREAREELRGYVRFGIQSDTQVTGVDAPPGQTVSQIFCSALPVAYSDVPSHHWDDFALLVLEAAYEATLHAALLNREAGGSERVLLTRLGGGAFGNHASVIDRSMSGALERFRGHALDVVIVSHGRAPASTLELEEAFR